MNNKFIKYDIVFMEQLVLVFFIYKHYKLSNIEISSNKSGLVVST